MPRAIEVAGLGVAAIGVVVALMAWLKPVPADGYLRESKSDVHVSDERKFVHDSTLKVSGTGAKLVLRVGEADSWYGGGEVSAINSNSVVYLPVGQRLKLVITGTGSLVQIDPRLLPYVQISNLGVGAKVLEIEQ